MKLNITSLQNALSQLKASFNYLNSTLAENDTGLRARFRNSTIQCFEFTHELGYKMVRRQLDQILGTTDELRQMNFADFVRTAADAGLIPDVKRFLNYREMRNITNHTYNQKKVESIITSIPDFIRDTDFIEKELKSRNE